MASDVTTLWLIRCGDTLWQREERLQGQADIPLSPEGRAAIISELTQIGAIRSNLNGVSLDAAAPIPTPTFATVGGAPIAVHHPPDEAATETGALVVRALGGKARRNEGLAEPDLGLFTGLTLSVVRERFPTRHRQWEDEPISLVPPEGEPLATARRRLLDAVAELVHKHRGKSFGIVLHPMALGFLRCALARRGTQELWRQIEGRPRIEEYLLPGDAEDRLAAEDERVA